MFEDRATTPTKSLVLSWRRREEPAMTWRYFNGYHECYQYINDEGCIVGEVNGSAHEKSKAWFAYLTPGNKYESLGRYVTVDAAKSAVIRALHDRTVEGRT